MLKMPPVEWVPLFSSSKCKMQNMYEVVFVDSFLNGWCLWTAVKQQRYNMWPTRLNHTPERPVSLSAHAHLRMCCVHFKMNSSQTNAKIVRAKIATERIHYELKNVNKYFPIWSAVSVQCHLFHCSVTWNKQKCREKKETNTKLRLETSR